MEILFVHLLNNYTGSPNVLANFLKEYSQNHENIHLLTSKTKGFLSNIDNIKYFDNKYRWCANKLFLTFILIFSQLYQFFFVLFGKKHDCVYVNTILPFGVVLAAKLRKERIIYHIHEYYPKPHLMQRFCVDVASKCGDKYIFVSQYLKSCYTGIFEKSSLVVHNAVSTDFHSSAKNYICQKDYIENKFNHKQIVLPCALKKYKGVNLFLGLAKKLPEYDFLLVTSNSKIESDNFFRNEEMPRNFNILNQISDMSKIYSYASLVMNLSIPHGIDKIIETFSMILVEAFEFKTPCIAPCYGGPLEIINNGDNGFLLEIENESDVIKKIYYILSDLEIYKNFCEKAFMRSYYFSFEKFVKSITEIIQEVIGL